MSHDIRTPMNAINQIFFNLLSNASKFTPSGGMVEFIPHMYDAFSQERSKLTDNSNSTGLGLPIVKSLVDAMDGTISVKSELNVGTEFTIDMYFPLANPADVVGTSENVHRESLKDARILLVEDNEINIYVAKMLLERVGCIMYLHLIL